MTKAAGGAPSGPFAPHPGEPGAIQLRWLIHLRWAAVAGQLGTILFVALGLDVSLPLTALGAVLLVELASNVALEVWTRRQGRRAGLRRWQTAVMIFDTLLLSALLYLTGGVANPFAVFFLVHIVLAAVSSDPRTTYVGAAVASACLLLLYFVHRPLDVLADPQLHLLGWVVSLILTVAITVYFVTSLTRSLQQRSDELTHERELHLRAERLEALGTLAAGAAHELASPLSTIAVVAKELERRLARGADREACADARLVRDEVARCRRILDRMTLESGDSAGEPLVAMSVEELFDDALLELAHQGRIRQAIAPDATGLALRFPREGLAMALRNLLSNALDASPPGAEVVLAAERRDDELEVSVRDEGPGMNAHQLHRAQDPFFTTKEPGQGMGLGLFLTRSVVDRLGGALHLESRPGAGTTVRVRLPLDAVARAKSPTAGDGSARRTD
jgi:two-component system sensor histidine kinase RegB